MSSRADTLGRNLIPSQQTNTTDYTGCVQPAVPNAINSAYTVNYPGPNGANRVMKVCSATYSLATNFKMYDYNCPCPITEGSTSQSMIVTVVLYNGTSWATSPAWGFDYVSQTDRLTPSTEEIHMSTLGP